MSDSSIPNSVSTHISSRNAPARYMSWLSSACKSSGPAIGSDITTETTEPTESGEDRDAGGHGGADTGDEPTESEEDRDAGGHGGADTGDEA